ncbi:hypothetical protein FZI85_10300 [Mycobacterium sp. CBMA293]|uniref:hypothetical protein n=1 Tax=unclassified Mycolicibacterium TaxID=2636767 RepID=UPI0012DE8F34|nr:MULTISPECIES: hypothetical protein [unclassified Mycolicibacterium]MUL49272.1 hypothetical protein [Mycolicibacterium sp. CBMA 360]MUL58930.1 hypothetical protein [Mycolicibacterium sp. CBMA 335]MUL69324.1 hypothetical protein [Mycolicibacterium sp. CBMA 311]MUL94288.1 hypothetical protein [Mycolicibacterium sp. CBMA 230]MUM04060.1 hypothetical protein [Mycolicibacterium sp. CBMA 213]
MTRRQFILSMWVALTATLCLGDHYFHVRTATLRYHWTPFVDGQSVWVWLVFAAAAAAMIASSVALPLTDVPDTVPWRSIISAWAVFVAAYAISGVVGASGATALSVTLVAAWLVRIALCRQDRLVRVLYSGILAVVGVVGEGLFSMAGLFDYQLQQVVNCPWWLAGLYLHGGLALVHIARGAQALGVRNLTITTEEQRCRS